MVKIHSGTYVGMWWYRTVATSHVRYEQLSYVNEILRNNSLFYPISGCVET